MGKEQEPREKTTSLAKKILGWGIVVAGATVGLHWFLGLTAGL